MRRLLVYGHSPILFRHTPNHSWHDAGRGAKTDEPAKPTAGSTLPHTTLPHTEFSSKSVPTTGELGHDYRRISMMEYIYFNSRDELLRLRITEIAYFESDGNYCNVVTANKLRSPIGMNLTNLEHALDKQLGNEATTFIRIGKRFIVNKRYICKVNIPKQRLVITDYDRFTFQLPISRDALKQLKALITLSTEKK